MQYVAAAVSPLIAVVLYFWIVPMVNAETCAMAAPSGALGPLVKFVVQVFALCWV